MTVVKSNTNFIDDFFPNHVTNDIRLKFADKYKDKFIVADHKSTGKDSIFSGTLIKTDMNNTLKTGSTVYYNKSDSKLLIDNNGKLLLYNNKYRIVVNKIYNVISDCIDENEVPNKTNSRTSKYTRVKSFVYANVDCINDINNFKMLRIIEFEDDKGYSYQLKKALDYVFMLMTVKKYSFGPVTACKEACKKYNLNYKDVHSGNQARKNIRSACNRIWQKSKM